MNLNVVLSRSEMERKVQSELEWFTEDPGVQRERSFLGHTRKKKMGKRPNSHACLILAHPSFFGSFCFWGKVRRERLALRKINRKEPGLKEPFQLSFQTECYAGRLAPRH